MSIGAATTDIATRSRSVEARSETKERMPVSYQRKCRLAKTQNLLVDRSSAVEVACVAAAPAEQPAELHTSPRQGFRQPRLESVDSRWA